jgi:hypothetical protein
MEENGFTVGVADIQDQAAIKSQYQIPPVLQSCHTAIVGGYVVEGHVPVAEIRRLLAERPNIVGLAVAGMPIGSPGMEVPGAAPQPYDVIAFAADGRMEVYASYGQ